MFNMHTYIPMYICICMIVTYVVYLLSHALNPLGSSVGSYDEKQVVARKLTLFAYVWEGVISCSCMVQSINFLFVVQCGVVID